jgi:TRAP-type C4-dicarboxylate transport system permease small subunit
MLSKLVRLLNLFEEYMLCLMVLQMGLSIFLQVVMRYVFSSAITWLDELVHIEVILLTFFGAGLCIKSGAHISVDVLKKIVGKPTQLALDALGHIVIAAYVGFVIYFGANLIQLMSSHPHFTPTLRIPKHYLYVVVCIALGFIGLRSLIKSCQFLRQLRSGAGSEGQKEP